MRKLVVAFDVDETLIDKTDAPRQHVVDVLLAMEKSGLFDVIIWSGGGADYARFRARQLGLPEAIPCIAKDRRLRVDIAFDDSEHFKLADKLVHCPIDYAVIQKFEDGH